MKLSVAMITYNHKRFIAQAIESVLAQKVNFEYEIVIGEDCSTDGTRATVLDFQRRHPERIVLLLRDRNLGGPKNFIGTLAACRGEYLAILEGDDYWTCTTKLQRQVDFLEAHTDWAICCTRAEVRNEGGVSSDVCRAQTGIVFPRPPDRAPANGPDVSGLLPVIPRAAGTYTLDDLLTENLIPTCTVVYRWGGLPDLPRWYSRSSLGDLALHAIVAGQKKIELLDECMAVYRVHDGGMWSSLDRSTQVSECARMLAALNRHLGVRYTNILGPSVARLYLDLAMTARQRGRRIETGRHLISCIRNGALHMGISPRTLAGLAAYTLIGSGYKIFSRASRV